ncbi:integrator complex subunit 12 [Anguilla rostrata]|uniref:integrator complex subunit 12 n=1 Tax=Anguilla anguilla TaxID=7936 RepID=UPI0015B2A7D4|nr:integrator complex subunit 12 [Anguilla anguilla]XP_035275225.1 integrator complex subunit 12 [Anguilla anguilla]XP_035275226.1 integrator complex subunit 12 [Anguilla anguilla]XP_035275227.1 integrator complex subunit 12 [Anguilla anguilla]
MAATVSLELDPIFLKGLGYLNSKSRDSAEKLKALLDESLARGSDSSYRTSPKEVEVAKVSVTKVNVSKDPKQKGTSGSSLSSSNNGKSSSFEKTKKEAEKRPSEKVKVDLVDGVDPPKKPRLEKPENRSSPVTVQASKELSLPYLSSFDETSADDFAMEMGLACVVCRQMTVTSGNQLVECQECHNLYHQDCHRPQVTDKDVNDPRLVWYCARCTRKMKRMTQKPPQKPAPVPVTAVPVVKDTLVKKPELKPKPDTASTFQAFKRAEVKSSAAVSSGPSGGNSSLQSSSGLTGWAAFGAKTPAAAGKLGPAVQSSGGRSSPASSTQKPAAGLSALAGAKASLGTKATGSSGGSGGSSPGQTPLKPPPPLTLGKPGLSRSSSGDGAGKGAVASGGGGASGGNGNGGSSGGSGAKAGGEASASGKNPTSQESQLNAMKRLQMVKKKAAQKKSGAGGLY